MQLMMRTVCRRPPTNATADQLREQQAGRAAVQTYTCTDTDTTLCSDTFSEEENHERWRDDGCV